MEGVFLTHIIQSIGDGNYEKGMFNILVFIVLYLQIRGLKTEVKAIHSAVDTGFKAGETRFSNIETRITKLENLTQP